jgi:hypothetical protein
MALQFIAKDPESGDDGCPSVWVDHDNGELVIQGWNADGAMIAECLTSGSVPGTESIVRLPIRMAQILREACDAADGAVIS